MLELSGQESSFKKQRELLIKDRAMIDAVCNRIDSRVLSNRFTETEHSEDEQSDLMKLPYIEYRKGSWQRADLPMDLNLSTCSLLGKSFSCSSSDKKAYIEQLKELENEVKLMDELGY